jgi:hypothetical protein
MVMDGPLVFQEFTETQRQGVHEQPFSGCDGDHNNVDFVDQHRRGR